ncbi:MAG: hypothetical protein SA339_13420 [Methanomassiliicoccus sp.]|nr:hypothetical protein [Methanomassiliicoccus sp.]
MSSIASKWAPFGRSKKMLAVLLVLGFIMGFLLTPLGFETRMNEMRTPAFIIFFIIVGLVMPIVSLVLLFIRPRFAAVLTVTNAVLLFLTVPADQALFFFTSSPPLAVSVGEYILIFVGIGYMLLGPRVYAATL